MSERTHNHVCLLGRLGKDIEVRHTQAGIAVSSLSIATSRRFKRNDEWVEETDWHNCVLWRNEGVHQYLTKGKRIHVEGRLQQSSYVDKDNNNRRKVEVIVEKLILLDGGEEDGVSRSRDRQARDSDTQAEAVMDDHGGFADDDVPF